MRWMMRPTNPSATKALPAMISQWGKCNSESYLKHRAHFPFAFSPISTSLRM